MSTINYNGIDLGYVRTAAIEQRPKTEDSGTDVVWFAYGLKAETLFTVLDDGSGFPDPDPGETTPTEVMARVRHMLLQPRKALTYKVGDKTLIEVKAQPGSDLALDANNGPKPTACDITQVTESTFRVVWSCEVALADCDAGKGQKFASNRWEQAHDIDEKGYSTRTTTGTVWVRSDMRVNPDQLRGITAPPLPDNFRRRASYQLQKDGLALRYTYTDVEKYLLPPAGAVDASMEFRITTQMGAKWLAQCDVMLEGAKGANKRFLLSTATAMALRKIQQARPVKDRWRSPVIMNGSWAEAGFENRVNVMLEAQLNITPDLTGDPGGLAALGKAIFDGAATGAVGLGAAVGQGGTQGAAQGGAAGAAVGVGVGIGRFFGKPKQDTQQQQAAVQAQQQQAAAVATAQVDKPAPMTVTSLPFLRMGTLPKYTDRDAPGIDPGLRGNGDFLKMVAAAFRDPCVQSSLARLEDTTLKPLPGGDVEATGGGLLPGVVGVLGRSAGGDSGIVNKFAPDDNALVNFSVVGTGTLTDEDTSPPAEAPVGFGGQDFFPGSYELWECDIEQVSDNHAAVLSATVTDEPNVPIQWANPGLKILVKWSAVKIGFPPVVPVCVDKNLVPIRTTTRQPTIRLAGDGVSVIYECTGTSEYHAIDPSKVALRQALPPWIKAKMRDCPPPIPYVLDLSTDASTSVLSNPDRPVPAGITPTLVSAGPLVSGQESTLTGQTQGGPPTTVPPVNP